MTYSIELREKVLEYRETHSLENTREVFGINISTIRDWEKLRKTQEENPEKATYYVDETGIDTFLFRARVRAKRGEKVYSKIRGRKFERVSIVAGKSSDKVVAPMIYSGTADSSLFENWFENQFCPEISGNICVMDNASIHRKNKLFEIAEKFNVILIFQPPYSPDLNKIEKYWAWLKKKLKTVLRSFGNLRDTLCHCFQLKELYSGTASLCQTIHPTLG